MTRTQRLNAKSAKRIKAIQAERSRRKFKKNGGVVGVVIRNLMPWFS